MRPIRYEVCNVKVSVCLILTHYVPHSLATLIEWISFTLGIPFGFPKDFRTTV